MPDSKIVDLTSRTSPALTDLLYLVDSAGTTDYKVALSALLDLRTQVVVKDADESVTSSTTLQDDNELLVPLVANVDYSFTAWLYVVTAATPDFKLAFTVPAAASLVWEAICHDAAGGAKVFDSAFPITASGTSNAETESSGGAHFFKVWGSVRNGANAGNLTLQWAQNTSSGTAATVKAGSWLSTMRS